MEDHAGTEDRPAITRAHRFELSLWFDDGAEHDPAQWRFTLSDTLTNEQVGGIGVSGLPEAVALLTSRGAVGIEASDRGSQTSS